MSLKISRFKTDEVKTVFQNSKHRIKTSGLKIFIAPKILEFGRILVVISRKVCNSPKRNRLRRRLKSIFYEEKLYDLGYDWVVLTSKEAKDLSFDQLKKIITNVVKEKL